MSRIRRAFHPDLAAGAGAVVRLSADESHHVRRVLRLRRGDLVSLFDGRGAEWSGRLAQCDASVVGVELRFRLEDTVESPLSVRIFQGLCRPDRLEWVIQKGTELGVAAIYPLECERGERPPQGPPRADRWRRIALEACKQSGRRVLPDVSPAETLPAAEDRCALLLDPGPDAVPLRTALPAGSPAGVDLAVGPEGGFTDAERDLACGNGWIPVSLGPRVLRTETAGLVAAAIVLHCLGDLGAV